MEPVKERFEKLFSAVTLQSILSDMSHAVAIERFGPRVSKRIFWRAITDKPRIALTFDDGPQAVYTPKLLKVLNRHKVRATFFLIGKHVEKNYTLAQEICLYGHEIANHTFTHPLMFRLTDAEMVTEIARTHQLLRDLNGVRPKFLRPPMGLFSRRVLNVVEQSGYKTVVGDVYPRDSHMPGKDKIVDRVLSRVLKGSIIILHDGGNSNHIDRSQTIGAVDRIIPELRERGFEFVTLSELLPG